MQRLHSRAALALLVIFAGVDGHAQVAPRAATTITSATCEHIGADTYRIEFELGARTGPISIYASASPERIEAGVPIASTRISPVTVTVPGRAGRVYFHLKPASGPTRVVSIRRLPLEGALNFRDLGGYRTGDGRFVIKWGLLYRTDHLVSLTPGDYAYLEPLGIRLVCDLRTSGERERAPTKWQGRTLDFQSSPILTDSAIAAAMQPLPPDEFKRRLALASLGKPLPLSGNYDRFVIDYAPSYAQVLQRLVSGDLPAATHCTAGQDRTGVYSAIVLTMLGVPWATVVDDYLLTSRYRLTDAAVQRTRDAWQQEYGIDVPPAVVRTMQGLRAETLKATFSTIERTYGSFDAFRREALNISDRQLITLRARLLEP